MPGSDDDQRPELARLAERILAQEVRDFTTLFTAAVQAARDPGPESLWGLDQAAAGGNEGAQGALAYASEQVQRWIFSVHDHAEVLLLLLKHQKLLLIPSWTNARALLEPVLLTCWLLDAKADSSTRIARAASLMPGVIEGAIRQLGLFSGEQDELEAKHAARDELVEYNARHGIESVRRRDKHGVIQDEVAAVVYDGRKASINHNITQLAHDYLPEDRWLYGLLSGATHSKPWLLNGLTNDADEAIRAIIAPLMPVSDAFTKAVTLYLGLDGAPYLARHARRLQALMERGSPIASIDRSTRPTAFGTFQRGLRPDEIAKPRR